MRKTAQFLSILVPVVFYFFGARIASAQTLCPASWAALCNIHLEKSNLFGTIIEIILILAAVISLVFLILGGIRWITSGGDRAKIASARSTLIAALVGLLISFFTFLIIGYIFSFFTGQDLQGGLNVPRLVP